jgi:hypothetical protein
MKQFALFFVATNVLVTWTMTKYSSKIPHV